MVEDGILRWQSPLAASRFVIHLRGMRRLDRQPTTTIIVNPSMVLYDPPPHCRCEQCGLDIRRWWLVGCGDEQQCGGQFCCEDLLNWQRWESLSTKCAFFTRVVDPSSVGVDLEAQHILRQTFCRCRHHHCFLDEMAMRFFLWGYIVTAVSQFLTRFTCAVCRQP